jgi:SAM-dependent methyltransferase
MDDFYSDNSFDYFERTAFVDPKNFLEPFVKRLPPPARVLDVGCGSGRDLLWLRARGYRVLGLERSIPLAALARKHAGCDVVEADFGTWDFAANPVDGILLVGALVHIPPENFHHILGRVTCGLVPGGKVLLTVKEGDGLSDLGDGRRFYLWRDRDMRGLVKKLGFRILYFDRSVSTIRNEDIWLTYLLEKIDVSG